ncbi:MAG: 30S ribosomal protein S8 [bacterium]
MASTDPVSDLLAAVSNASRAYLDTALVPHSAYKQNILKILQEEGFIRAWRAVGKEPQSRRLEVSMHYGPNRERLLNGVRRVSRPGRRVYVGLEQLKPYLHRLEVALLSTPQGVLTGPQAFARKTGGELLCLVW